MDVADDDAVVASPRPVFRPEPQPLPEAASKSPLQRLYEDSTWKLMLAGGLAGCVSKTVTAPLARLTILYQVQTTNSVPGWSGGGRPPSVAQALGRVARQEGVAALWKGNGVTIVHRLPYSALNFMAYERVMALFCAGQPPTHRSDASPMAVAHRLAAGATAGCLACVATYPLDLVRTRLAAQTTTNVVYTGLRHALRTIVATEGVRGLYRGLGATLIGVAPSLAINFAVYETLRGRAAAAHPHAHPTVLALCAGSAAGAASATICFPLDLVRRRMQLAGAARGGLVAAAKAVAAREGAKGFYRGLVPELAKVVPGVGIAFSVFEGLKRALAIE